MKKLLLGIALVLLSSTAEAADLPTKAAAVPYVSTPCTVTLCSGFYAGFHVEGAGTNADILGSGLNGSIFNNGVGLGAQAGYQFWNGNFFIAGEVGATYYTGPGSTISTLAGINQTWSVDTVAKLGYGLQGLFNGPPGAASGPVTPIQALNGAMLSPFFTVGERFRDGMSGFIAGAGLCYTLGGHSEACAEYRHVTYNKGTDVAGVPITIGSEQSVLASYNYKF